MNNITPTIIRIARKNDGQYSVGIKMPIIPNPYDRLIGQPVENVPVAIASFFSTWPNPHLLCSVGVCEQAFGLKDDEPSIVRARALLLIGTTIRDHAMHLHRCLQVGMIKDTELMVQKYSAKAVVVLQVGRLLETLIAGDNQKNCRVRIGGMIAPDTQKLLSIKHKLNDCLSSAISLVRAFSKLDNGEQSVPEEKYVPAGIDYDDWGKRSAVFKAGARPNRQPVSNRKFTIAYDDDKNVPLLVGPLARLKISSLKAVKQYYYALPVLSGCNRRLNLLAMAVECVELIVRAQALLGQDLHLNISQSLDAFYPGKYELAIEAPRGILLHQIELNNRRELVNGSMVIPTRQNIPHLKTDLKNIITTGIDKYSKQELESQLLTTIRTYNPCFDQSNEMIKFDWVNL